MALVHKLGRILERQFPHPDTVEIRDGDGIIGVVTSRQFRRMDTVQRQNVIQDLLATHLTPKEMRRVLFIVAVTPEEERAHTA